MRSTLAILVIALLANSSVFAQFAPVTAPDGGILAPLADAPVSAPDGGILAPLADAPIFAPDGGILAPLADAPIAAPEGEIAPLSDAPIAAPEGEMAPIEDNAPLSNSGSIAFTGNVSLNLIQENHYQYRLATLGHLDLGTAAYRGWFRSINIAGTGNAAIDADVIWGEIMAGTLMLPSCYVAYFTNDNAQGENYTNALNNSRAIIGGFYHSLTELDANGNVVATIDFLGQLGLGLTWRATDIGEGDGLHWVTVTGTEIGKSYEIAITFIVTDRIGVINKADAVVNPRSIESIFEVKNYTYATTGNKLRLKLGVTTSGAIMDGPLRLNSGIAASRVYMALQEEAEIDGALKDLKITSSISGDFSLLGAAAQLIESAIRAVYGNDLAQLAQFDIDFPVGATNIAWDPQFGQGDIFVESSNSPRHNSASNVAIAAGTIVATLASLLLLV